MVVPERRLEVLAVGTAVASGPRNRCEDVDERPDAGSVLSCERGVARESLCDCDLLEGVVGVPFAVVCQSAQRRQDLVELARRVNLCQHERPLVGVVAERMAHARFDGRSVAGFDDSVRAITGKGHRALADLKHLRTLFVIVLGRAAVARADDAQRPTHPLVAVGRGKRDGPDRSGGVGVYRARPLGDSLGQPASGFDVEAGSRHRLTPLA